MIHITPTIAIDESEIQLEFMRASKPGGQKVNKDGVLIIKAQRFRTQDRNREDAMGRLIELIRKAAEKPKPRRRTRPTRASKRRRLESKRRRGETKRMRRPVPPSED